jgi:RNA polymerase sigma factor (sigma-70 family)
MCKAAPGTDAELLELFLEYRDETAFATLVQRHGPMVMGVCRRLLRDPGDAEDAFQATFLVLVRKAFALTGQASLAPWLHGVAQRTALKARSLAARRAAWQEPLHIEPPAKVVPTTDAWEWQVLLEQEVQRLPDKYRVPVVLCYLAGQSKRAAAAHLGLPEGTVSSRLARARETLHRRLSRRGVVLSGIGVGALLTPQAVTAHLRYTTTAMGIKAISHLPFTLPPTVETLSQGVLRAMRISSFPRSGLALGFLLLCGLVWACSQPLGQRGGEPRLEPHAATPQPGETQGRIEGRITAADTGKPVAGVTVKVLVQGIPGNNNLVTTQTDAQGRYSIAVPWGHVNLWGLSTPAGYYTQDERSWDQLLTTTQQPTITRNFVLQPGKTWQVHVAGLPQGKENRSLISAMPDPDRQLMRSGESIMVTTDDHGAAALTLPPRGGRYRLSWTGTNWAQYESTSINLEVDTGFDPSQVTGVPESLPNRKAIRLTDQAGRTAIVDGGTVTVVKGQTVLHFVLKPVAATVAFTLRGRVVDEKGTPLAGALATVAFTSQSGGAMSQFEARSNAEGQYTLTMRLPTSFIRPDSQIGMMVIKSGYHGAPTEKLSLSETQKRGTGDLGTVTLTPGRTLRGTVVDENGQPVQGAIVTNMTNYFLYGHLRCRTDAAGKFIMPDLAWGQQQVSAQWGERVGEVTCTFDEAHPECTITVRFMPKSGLRPNAWTGGTSSLRPTRPVALPARSHTAWDLTPPKKEPQYQKEPKYALLVFGPKREHRTWLVLDGTTLYVDTNGNGDLTEPGKRLQPHNPKDGSNRFTGAGSHTHFDVFEFVVQTANGGTSKFKLNHWIPAENYVPKTEFEKHALATRQKLGYANSTLWRLDGLGRGQTPLIFMPKPADAQVCALDGPLTFVLKLPQYQILQRGEGGSNLSFHIATIGLPHRGGEHLFFNPLAISEVPEWAYMEVEIEYPTKTTSSPPLRRKYQLKERSCGDTFHGPVQVPAEAGSGRAKVTVRMVGWPVQEVLPATVEVPLED